MCPRHANISASIVVHSKENLDREEFKEAWAELREEVMGQKDGKRRDQFFGVSKERDVSKKNETFVLVETSQTPVINYQQGEEPSGLTSLTKACGLEDAFFVRLADIPSNKTIVTDGEEPLNL